MRDKIGFAILLAIAFSWLIMLAGAIHRDHKFREEKQREFDAACVNQGGSPAHNGEVRVCVK